jgi:hypothetical protein
MRGMQVLVDTPIQLLQLNAGFLTENNLLFLVIHVPIARPEYIFNLKRFVGMPVRLSDESMAHSGGNDRFCARLKTDISASNSGL